MQLSDLKHVASESSDVLRWLQGTECREMKKRGGAATCMGSMHMEM